jgi:fumarylacetoacetase
MASWIPGAAESGFSLQNLPYGVFSTAVLDRRIGVAVGDQILDMRAMSEEGMLDDLQFDTETLLEPVLNAFASQGKDAHRRLRQRLQRLLAQDSDLPSELRDSPGRRNKVFISAAEATMHVPMSIGDYTDFFVGLYHAQNVSRAQYTAGCH